MKKKSRILALNLILIVMLFTFNGCGLVEGAKGLVAGLKERVVADMSDAPQDDDATMMSISTECYGYSHLKDEEKKVYDQMLDCILKHEEKTTLTTLDIEVVHKVFKIMMADHGEIFWVSGYTYNTYSIFGKVTSVEIAPNYIFSQEEVLQYQQEVDEVVVSWLSGISVNDSDYDKVKYVYETLINNVDYAIESENNQNILSVFIGRSTVCQGYSCAAQYMLRELGISSMIVSGVANDENHAWNLIQMDGEYYYMDLTWGNSKYMSKQDITTKHINYEYMATTTEEILKNHVIEMDIAMPECTATENDYFHHEGLYIDSFDKDRVGELLAVAWYRGDESISIKMSSREVYDEVLNYLIGESAIFDWCIGLKRTNYIEDPELLVLSFSF
ncbi:MAG: hypothetical protein K6B67_00100 [Lachnospiraceae bacterium]|nr:hypothetical protein [Lachnospiraceae bacterium]